MSDLDVATERFEALVTVAKAELRDGYTIEQTFIDCLNGIIQGYHEFHIHPFDAFQKYALITAAAVVSVAKDKEQITNEL